MHNKSFTADNQATIIGGRNIGDEYFGARDEGLFLDLDVLALGPVVEDVSRDFDRYWASESAYPAARILPEVSLEELKQLSRQASLVETDPAARSEEHTSELQSLMRISYAVFCLKKKHKT